MNKQQNKKRVYRKITPETVAKFNMAKLEHGNGTQAVIATEPDILSPEDRAFKIAKKSKEVSTTQFIDDKLQQIGVDAIQRVGMMVNSSDERIATKNTHYVIDHIRGQATKRSITLSGKLNVQDILD